jgi:ATP-dependent RNA helicase DDX54/DBP10
MPRRAASPALSENEVDIAGSLFANDADSDGEIEQKPGNATFNDLDFNSILNTADASGSDDGGDEDFIALQQRSSNRKASNLQGKSVKKGGGFQAMGKRYFPFHYVYLVS